MSSSLDWRTGDETIRQPDCSDSENPVLRYFKADFIPIAQQRLTILIERRTAEHVAGGLLLRFDRHLLLR